MSRPERPVAASDAGFRAALRCLAEFAPDLGARADGAASLELSSSFAQEPVRITSSSPIEGHGLRAVRVEGVREPGFHAFLDGTQRSRVLTYADGVPIVHATVAAVVRVRVNRRLFTWTDGARVEQHILAPRRALPHALWSHLETRFPSVLDVGESGEASPADTHPMRMAEQAVHRVQERREALEEQLAAEWCSRDGRMLALDGGLKHHDQVVRARCAVGIVKSHRTMYVDGEALLRVLRLRAGERSTVFRVDRAPGHRAPVASWYLRLRDAVGRDPFWGLVRVEAADPQVLGESPEDMKERANRISNWILAEVAPLSIPDARWDRMIYPIRDCEEFLRAIA
jgi:hypothetical protein